MTPDELRAIGESLFGPGWQSPLARALGINPRTVRRWVAGQYKPKPELVDWIRRLVEIEANVIEQNRIACYSVLTKDEFFRCGSRPSKRNDKGMI